MTIYDIAKIAHVSPATVSRVLTKKSCVSDRKREAVENIIRQYRFKPNAAAQSLSLGSRIIGLMIADIRNSYYASMAIECEKAAQKLGYTVLLCNLSGDQAYEHDHVDMLYAQRVEAIIQLGRATDDVVSNPAYAEHVNRISRTIPFITSGKLDGVDHFSVRINHAQAMMKVMDYLVSIGHREIAFVGGYNKVLPTYEKWNQYLLSLGTHNLEFRNEFIKEGEYSSEEGYSFLEQLLEAKTLPTAVIAINDECALGVILAALDHGLSIPRDISVVGFDNGFHATLIRPSLTTVDYNYPLFAGTLVETAVQLAEGKKPPREILIEPQLVIRESCCRPRQAKPL